MAKRVLIFGEYGTLNGGENSLLAIVPELIRIGWELSAAIPCPSPFASALREASVNVIDLPSFENAGQRLSQTEIRDALAVVLKQEQPDLIHCNSLSTGRLLGPVASELGIPSLGFLRDILKLSKTAIADLNRLGRLIAVSSATRQWHCDQGLDPERTFVSHNGVDTTRFCPANMQSPDLATGSNAIREELKIPPSSPILLSVGQIGMRKGVDTLLESYLAIADTFPATHLLIAGARHSNKQEAIEYEQRAHELGQTSAHCDKIHWLGTRHDTPDLMRAATILIHAARQEPLGRVLLEAAASALPIVTTRVGGSPEIFAQKNLDWLLVPPNTPQALATAATRLLSDSKLRDNIGAALRQRASLSFSVEQSGRRLELHYRQLAGLDDA
ncbi:MAG: glycosyltransferase involved in cell wall biosynthesis [Mariniblastus sp.]|jgi:glycosyltransferase involved in cell wall biosynthesis